MDGGLFNNGVVVFKMTVVSFSLHAVCNAINFSSVPSESHLDQNRKHGFLSLPI